MLRTSTIITGVTGARCGHPVKLYDYPGRTDFAEVCWRPAGHRAGRHLSRWAYMNELRRSRERNYKAERDHRKMTVPPDKMDP